VTVHLPRRPAWNCLGCGAPWPCETRKKQLLAEYDGTPVSLGLLMTDYFNDAMHDLPRWATSHAYLRFVGWIRTYPDNSNR
jgi:hypothetical protein